MAVKRQPGWKLTKRERRERRGKVFKAYWVKPETHAALLRVTARLNALAGQVGFGRMTLDDALWRAARELDERLVGQLRKLGVDPGECLRELESEQTVAPPPRLDGVVRDD